MSRKKDVVNQLIAPKKVDLSEATVIEFNDPYVIKKRLEMKAFRHVEDMLDAGGAKANNLAKMILEKDHYNKANVKLNISVKDMKADDLLAHMQKLITG